MKRMIAFTIACCLLLTLAACGTVPAYEDIGASRLPSESEDSGMVIVVPGENGEGDSSVPVLESEESKSEEEPPVASQIERDPVPLRDGKNAADGNLVFLTSKTDFAAGQRENVAVADLNDGALRLAPDGDRYQNEGTYTSKEFETKGFEHLVVTWNADTPLGSTVELQARVRVYHYAKPDDTELTETWSEWFSWGAYSPYIERGSVIAKDNYAFMNIDTLTVKSTEGEYADALQLRAVLRTQDVSVTPTVRAIYASFQNADGTLAPVYESKLKDGDWLRAIDTPCRSQMTRAPGMSQSICSPVTISMLTSRGYETTLPEAVAMNVFDNTMSIYGNWSYNIAFAGFLGHEAYAAYTNLEGLRREIAAGYPVGLSVAYTNDPDDDSLPYVNGAPLRSEGHLLVLCGFETRGGVEYALVHDPAAATDAEADLAYRTDELTAAWSGMAYFVHGRESGADASLITEELRLLPTDDGYKLYMADGTTPFSMAGYRIVFVASSDGGKTYTFPTPVRKALFLFKGDVAGLQLWAITSLGKVFTATIEN